MQIGLLAQSGGFKKLSVPDLGRKNEWLLKSKVKARHKIRKIDTGRHRTRDYLLSTLPTHHIITQSATEKSPYKVRVVKHVGYRLPSLAH